MTTWDLTSVGPPAKPVYHYYPGNLGDFNVTYGTMGCDAAGNVYIEANSGTSQGGEGYVFMLGPGATSPPDLLSIDYVPNQSANCGVNGGAPYTASGKLEISLNTNVSCATSSYYIVGLYTIGNPLEYISGSGFVSPLVYVSQMTAAPDSTTWMSGQTAAGQVYVYQIKANGTTEESISTPFVTPGGIAVSPSV